MLQWRSPGVMRESNTKPSGSVSGLKATIKRFQVSGITQPCSLASSKPNLSILIQCRYAIEPTICNTMSSIPVYAHGITLVYQYLPKSAVN